MGGDELIGDESDSDLDPEDLEIINSGTTQVKDRVEGGSRTIMIPVNHDILKDTKDVILSFGSFCSDTEHKTLGKLNDNILSKSIGSLALRVNLSLSYSLSFVLFFSRVFLSTYFLCLCLQTVILELESVQREKK